MINQIQPHLYQLHFKAFNSCVYLLKLRHWILIDTGSKDAKPELLKDLETLKIKPDDVKTIIKTHNHYDHIENTNLFTKAKIYSAINIDELKKQFPELKIIQTPGHSNDSICIQYKDILFSGDTIFDSKNNYMGRTDLPESNPKQMKKSLESLKKLKYKILCPGHLV